MAKEEMVTQDPTDNIENEGEHLENQEEESHEESEGSQDEEKTLVSLQKQKEHWRKKAKELEARLSDNKEEPKKEEHKKVQKISTDLISHEDYTDIKLEYPYLDKDDIYKAARWAKSEGQDIHSVIKDDWFKSYADKKYAEIKSQQATPRPNNRSNSVAGIDLEAMRKDPSLYRKLSDKEKEQVKKKLGW